MLNSVLYDKKLGFSVINTYKAFQELNLQQPKDSENTNWCGIADAFQTSAIAAQEDYKLKHLAEQFQLSGTLI
jgi:hypothetical protein